MLCAWGDVTTILKHEVSMTFIRILSQTSLQEILDALNGLLKQVKDVMCEEQGVPEENQVRGFLNVDCGVRQPLIAWWCRSTSIKLISAMLGKL